MDDMNAEQLMKEMARASERFWAIVDATPGVWGPDRDPAVDDAELQAASRQYEELADHYEQVTGQKLMIRNCRIQRTTNGAVGYATA